MKMENFLKRQHAPFKNNVAAALEKSILAGTLHADLKTATTFVEDELAKREGSLPPLGLAAPILSPDEIKDKMRTLEQTVTTSQVLFSGSLRMLDLDQRVEPMENLDMAKMKFACQMLSSPAEVPKVVETVHIVSDAIESELIGLRRADGDENIDAVIWAIYHNQACTPTVNSILTATQNLVFSAERCGLGLGQKVERFRLIEEEDKKRNCMGKSAFNKARILLDLVHEARKSGDTNVNVNLKDDALAESILMKDSVLASWKKDTCANYLYMADRLGDIMFAKLSQSWEHRKGKDAL